MGVLSRTGSRAAQRVSRDLRGSDDSFVVRRRRIAGLSLVSAGAMGVVAAYQYGLVGHVPEPPLRILDADRVDAAPEAYEFLKTPDAALGLISAGLTLALAGAGPADRFRRRPWLVLVLAAKLLGDAVLALGLSAEQATKHRRFCRSVLQLVSCRCRRERAPAPQVAPEARAAFGTLTGREARA